MHGKSRRASQGHSRRHFLEGGPFEHHFRGQATRSTSLRNSRGGLRRPPMGQPGDGTVEGVEPQLGTGREGFSGETAEEGAGPWRGRTGRRGGLSGERPEVGRVFWGKTGRGGGPRGGARKGRRALEEGRGEEEEGGGGSVRELPKGEKGGREVWFRVMQTLHRLPPLFQCLPKTTGTGDSFFF